jgi:hypothetical protein
MALEIYIRTAAPETDSKMAHAFVTISMIALTTVFGAGLFALANRKLLGALVGLALGIVAFFWMLSSGKF